MFIHQKRSFLQSLSARHTYFLGKRNLHTLKISSFINITRPDTRPIPVAEGWAGGEMRVFTLSNLITMTDGPMDGLTDGRTDKASNRVACPQLKTALIRIQIMRG